MGKCGRNNTDLIKDLDRLGVRIARFNLERDIQSCTCCELHKYEVNRISKAVGNGNCFNPKFFVIGTAPSEKSKPYKRFRNGAFRPLRAFDYWIGAKFRQLLKESGIYDKSYITNILKCALPKNRNPSTQEMLHCSVWLRLEIKLLQPKVIITLGKTATNLIESLSTGTSRNHRINLFGKKFEFFATFHPNYCFSYGGIRRKDYVQVFMDIEKSF